MHVRRLRSTSSRSVVTALLLATLTVILALVPLTANSQSMSHEEEVVRNAYARLTLLCSLPPLTKAAGDQLFSGAHVDASALDKQIEQAAPSFELSDFRVGDVKDIADEQWGDYVDFPKNGSFILRGEVVSEGHADDGFGTTWHSARVQWSPVTGRNTEADQHYSTLTVAKIIELGTNQWLDNAHKGPIAFTRYAAFTVNATFEGKSSGPHKAIFLFGKGQDGKPEFVADNDLITGQNPVWYFLNNPTDLSGILLGRLREAPVVADWMRNNVMPASDCPRNSEVACCSHGRCGLAPVPFNQDMSVPLPPRKDR